LESKTLGKSNQNVLSAHLARAGRFFNEERTIVKKSWKVDKKTWRGQFFVIQYQPTGFVASTTRFFARTFSLNP